MIEQGLDQGKGGEGLAGQEQPEQEVNEGAEAILERQVQLVEA